MTNEANDSLILRFFNRCALESTRGNFFAYIGFLSYAAMLWLPLMLNPIVRKNLSDFVYRSKA